MIVVENIKKTFSNGVLGLNGVSLEIKKGEVFGLLGPNGAGKSTLIKVLSTLTGFDEGVARVNGYDVDRDPQKVRRSIGVVAQKTGIDFFLSGRENLELQGHLYKMSHADIQDRIKELSDYFALEDALENTVSGYSGGMQRKLDIATALMHRPELVFLDEPTLGLDIKSRKDLWNYIRKMSNDLGMTVLLTTHYLEEADKLSDRVGIINKGELQVVDTPQVLKKSVRGDAVTLHFEEKDAASDQFSGFLKAQDYVVDHRWQGSRLYLYVENGAAAVPRIMELAGKQGLTVQTIALSIPTLDDVFLRYTGTTLDGDGEEEEGEAWWMQWAGKDGANANSKWAKKWQEQSEDESAEGDVNQQEEGAASDRQQWAAKAEKKSDGPAQPSQWVAGSQGSSQTESNAAPRPQQGSAVDGEKENQHEEVAAKHSDQSGPDDWKKWAGQGGDNWKEQAAKWQTDDKGKDH